MRRAAVLTVGALLIAPVLPASAIIGGAPDDDEHPYVGQLLFYVPDAIDSRFDDPGGWFNCTGTLIDADTVVTAGHCTYAVGVDGGATADPLVGGNDVWFSVLEAPDSSFLPPSSTFVPDGNAARYEAWSTRLDGSDEWAQAESTFTHPEYVDSAFLLHDLGVVKLSEPIVVSDYGRLPEAGPSLSRALQAHPATASMATATAMPAATLPHARDSWRFTRQTCAGR